MAAEGASTAAMAKALNISRSTASLLRRAYLAERYDAESKPETNGEPSIPRHAMDGKHITVILDGYIFTAVLSQMRK